MILPMDLIWAKHPCLFSRLMGYEAPSSLSIIAYKLINSMGLEPFGT